MADKTPGTEKHGLPDIEELADQVRLMIEKLGKENGAEVSASVDLKQAPSPGQGAAEEPSSIEGQDSNSSA